MVLKNSKEMAKLAIAGLEEKKANDIKILDISDVSVLADYFIIASGSNRNQVQAMADEVEERLYKAGYGAETGLKDIRLQNWIFDGLSGYYCSYL